MIAIARLAALSGAIAVIAGAFGAHIAVGEAQQWLKTGGEYQMVHAVAALAARRYPRSAALMLGGSVLFAATLYAMALGAPHWLGAVTPIGGVGMIAGWCCLALSYNGRTDRN